MMGRQAVDQSQLFYLFNLEEHIPKDHFLRRINPIVTRVLADLREQLAPFYSDIGRPSIDPELMIRMLIVGYCYGIRFERRLCEEVKLHLGYRWFCRLELEDKVPDHSTFSVNRHGRFRDSDIFRQVFEAERAWMQVSSRASPAARASCLCRCRRRTAQSHPRPRSATSPPLVNWHALLRRLSRIWRNRMGSTVMEPRLCWASTTSRFLFCSAS